MNTATVVRDLGAILAHGEPDDGIGQGESTDAAARPAAEPPAAETTASPEPPANAEPGPANGRGELVTIDFGGLGPSAPPAA